MRELGARRIETLGILKAALKAMAQAVAALNPIPQLVLVDGNQPLPLTFPQQPVIKGDALCPSISAASIVAKVYRDTLMERLHQRYPQYNFARHKGYATAEHLEAIRCWGPCDLHRRHLPGRQRVAGRIIWGKGERPKGQILLARPLPVNHRPSLPLNATIPQPPTIKGIMIKLPLDIAAETCLKSKG